MFKAYQLYRQMGFPYVWFRVGYELAKHLGYLKRKFPYTLPAIHIPELTSWEINFVISPKNELRVKKRKDIALETRVLRFFERNELEYFNNPDLVFSVSNWHTNPENGYQYSPTQHWTKIPDFDNNGDIKFVWEKARFSYLQELIRYDYHFEQNCAERAFHEIMDWIDANPLNRGVHYRCGQEIAIRIFNWILALSYFRDDLNQATFAKIVQSIYEQTHRISANHVFAQRAVQNNHVLSEALALYAVGLCFPFLPDASTWKQQGRDSLEKAISYQFFDDGSYIQYSHNYHRFALQIVFMALKLGENYGEPFGEEVNLTLVESLKFLLSCQDISGELPNYGANDGALLLRLSTQHFRNYCPQLLSLANYLGYQVDFDTDANREESEWLGEVQNPTKQFLIPALAAFQTAGYFVHKTNKTLTFIRCGRHEYRPSQADNLHVDIWVDGENIIRDAGSFRYNDPLYKCFLGTKAHNTVSLGDNDQMQKGERFVWYAWTQATKAEWTETEEEYVFEGEILAFQQLGRNIKHRRRVSKHKEKLFWEVCDEMEHQTNLPMKQVWNISDDFLERFYIVAFDECGEKISPHFENTSHAEHYGTKQEAKQIVFESIGNRILTRIEAY